MELISTGGTAKALREAGLLVVREEIEISIERSYRLGRAPAVDQAEA